jgi:hypothetical protein
MTAFMSKYLGLNVLLPRFVFGGHPAGTEIPEENGRNQRRNRVFDAR